MSERAERAPRSRPARAAGGAAGTARRRWPAALRLAFATALTLSGVPAAADVLVYHSPAGAGAIPIRTWPFVIAENDTATLDLYIVKDAGTQSPGGPNSTNICRNDLADGDETCGFELIIKAEDDLLFTDFVPANLGAGDQIHSMLLLNDMKITLPGDFDELRVNGTKVTASWDPVPLFFGTIDVSSGSIRARARVLSGLHVDASGDIAAVPNDVIVEVPEASQISMLVAGLALLGLLQHLRSRRSRSRECS